MRDAFAARWERSLSVRVRAHPQHRGRHWRSAQARAASGPARAGRRTLTSWLRICGNCCTMRLMLRSATYWISGSPLSSVTSGGAIFFVSAARSAWSSIMPICFSTTCARAAPPGRPRARRAAQPAGSSPTPGRACARSWCHPCPGLEGAWQCPGSASSRRPLRRQGAACDARPGARAAGGRAQPVGARALTADSTTAQLACCRRGVTRSTMLSASLASRAV